MSASRSLTLIVVVIGSAAACASGAPAAANTPAAAASAPAPAPTNATPPATLMGAFGRAQAASAAHDWRAMRDALVVGRRYSPSHPAVLFHLARAEARLGNADAAMEALDELGETGVSLDVGADTTFAALRGQARFGAVVARIRAAGAPVVRGDTAFVIDDADFIPEGIAADPASGALFVGSLSRGSILRLAPDGGVSTFVARAAGETGGRVAQVLGLRVDPARRRLWGAVVVLDSTAPRYFRGPGGRATLRAWDLATGREVAAHAAPDETTPHLLNDIAIAANGDVWVTDSEGHALYRLRAGGDGLERAHGDSPRFIYPNGIALHGDRLYVAHVEGIAVFDTRAPDPFAPRPLAATRGIALGGIDGLYACGSDLIAVQALLDHQRVVRFALDASRDTVRAAEVLEQRHPASDVPTTGAITGSTFHYIAGSQLGRLRPDGRVSPAAGAPHRSVVVRLPMGRDCAHP